MLNEVFGNSKRGIRIICPYITGQRKRKVPPWMTKKVFRIRKYKSVLWKKYHNSESYNDIREYKRVLNRATSEYKKAKYSFETKLASNIKLIPSPFMHM